MKRKPTWNKNASSVTPKTIDMEPIGKPSLLADHLTHTVAAAALEGFVKGNGKTLPDNLLVPLTQTLIKYKPMLYLIKRILMNHGVYQAFSLRRDLYKLRTELKKEVKELNEFLTARGKDGDLICARHYPERTALVACLQTTEDIQKRIKIILNQPRWSFPNNDKKSKFEEI